MKRSILLSISLLAAIFINAQTIYIQDPDIKNMVDEISGDNIEKYINKLVSFHSRNNFSAQNNPDIGIGASWNWVKKEMEQYIPQSEGRLSVDFVEYKAGGEGTRYEKEVELKNVVATLKGIDPGDDRVLLISAHLDSRASNGNDGEAFAPGANDDGSGIAAILELVRIMSKHKFSATIKFMAVSGEEHGLWGSAHMAKIAKEEGWNMIAMLNNDMIGNSGSSGTLLNDNMRVRVFSEGVPAYETEAMARMRAYTAGENDGKARQLARYTKEIGERYVEQLDVTLIFQKRQVRKRRRSYSILSRRFYCGTYLRV